MLKKMMNLEAMWHALRDRKLTIVAKDVGIAYDRLWRIATGRTVYLRATELQALSDYLSNNNATTTKQE